MSWGGEGDDVDVGIDAGDNTDGGHDDGGEDSVDSGTDAAEVNGDNEGDITDGSVDTSSGSDVDTSDVSDVEVELSGFDEDEQDYKEDMENETEIDYSGYDGEGYDDPYGKTGRYASKTIDNSQDMEISSTQENPYAKNPGKTEFYSGFKHNRYSPEDIKERIQSLKPAQQTRMINHQMSLLEKRMKDAAFKPGFLGEHTWGMFHKNSVRNQIDKMIDDFEEAYGETMTELGKANSEEVNSKGFDLKATDLLSLSKVGFKSAQGLLNMLGLAYHPIEAEKKFRALKVRYRLADEDDKWYHKPEADTVIEGITKEACNARAGWYWDDKDDVCRRGVDPNKEEEEEVEEVDIITGE